MASSPGTSSSDEPRRRFQSEIASYIAQTRWDLSSHTAFGEAFKDISVETLNQQAQLRRTVSCDSLPTATRTLDRIQSRGLQRHPNAVQKKPELRDVFTNPNADLERLRKAMKTYEASVPDDRRTKIDFTSKHSWDEVMQAVKAVQEEHANTKGFRERFRKSCGQILTQHAAAVLVWIEILPSQNEFFSPICGALKLIFGAAAKLQSVQIDILGAVEQIPSVLDSANNTLEMFRQHKLQNDSPLFFWGNNLMASILVTLNCIVNELTKRVSQRGLGALVKQNTYSESLSSALNSMNTNAMQLARAAKQSSAAALLDAREQIENLADEMEHLRDENRLLSEYTAHKTNLIHGDQAAEYSLAKRMDGKLDSILSKTRSLDSPPMQRKVVEAALVDLLPRFLASAERMNPRTGCVDEERESQRRADLERSSKARQQRREEVLSSVFRFDANIVKTDAHKKGFAGALDARAQDRAVALLKSAKLKTFMSEPHSSILFANANCNFDSSPTAYISATLASSIKQLDQNRNGTSQRTYALTFFCTRHTDKYDLHAGPRGLMRSFVSQLLSYYTPPLPYLRQAQGIDPEDLDDLFGLFSAIVSTLSRSTILFCIIDGLTSYENRFGRETTSLITSLLQLAQERKQGPVVKLWMSAPTNSRNLRGFLTNDEMISLQADVPRTGGLSSSRLSIL